MGDTFEGLERFAPHLPPALEGLELPCYILDARGRIRWLNAAATELVGDATGKLFTSLVDPHELRLARDEFASALRGEPGTPEFELDVFTVDGGETTLEISAYPIEEDHHAIGVFGVARPRKTPPAPPAPTPDSRLTDRQREILTLLADGASTDEIAKQLFLSRETVRNHIRHILQRLHVHSRIEALVVAPRDGIL